MKSGLMLIFTLTIGSVLIINGIAVKADDILASARQSADKANIHQLSLALEFYFLDHNSYPRASGGTELVNILAKEKYIKNRPADPSVFTYQLIGKGTDYKLDLK